jgi:PAS domain S-box-containing protein
MLAAATLAMGILASMLWTGMRRSTDAERWVEHTYQVIGAAGSVRSSLESAETSARGYLLTGDDQYLEEYQAAIASERQARADLGRLTADNRTQQARLDEFDRLVQLRLDVLATDAIEARRRQGAAALAHLIPTNRGGKLMEQLLAILGAVDDEERRLLHSRTVAAGAADSRTRWILGLGSGSLVLLLILAGGSIERHIHERKEAERVLARQARLIDLSHDAVITADGNRVITGWNSGAQEMYGWTEKEAVGQTMHELLHTSSPTTLAEVDRILAQEGRWDGELDHTRSDGRQIAVESRQVLQRDEAGRPAGCLEINRDITGRKQAEEKLRLSEEKFARAFATNPAAIAITRLSDGLFVDVNDTWMALTGYSRDQVVGRRAVDFRLWPTPESRIRSVSELKEKGSFSGREQTFLKKSGETFAALSSAAILTIAGEEMALWAFLDVTERKRAEEALRESRAKLEVAVASMPAAVFISDAEGRFIHFNDAFATFHRFAGKEECAKTLAEYPAIIDVFLPDGTPAPLEMWPSARALRGETATNAEYTLRRKDTGESWVGSYSFGPIRDRDGRIAGSVVAGRDITESKRAEEEIRRLNAELEQRVRERTAQLEASNKELEAFAYSVSHDLRAPLRGIDGWSLALVEDYGRHLDQRAIGYLDRVRSETQRMGHLIDDLLQLSRITRAEMHRETVDLSLAAESIAARLREAHPERRLEFAIRPGMTASGDARLLEIALTNLLHNAVKFTGTRALGSIRFEAVECDGQAVFAVRDNGVGFDMAYASMLFGAFQRLHSESEFPGTGIGLATVQRVIHRHGGRVWAEAEPDRGASFYFTIGGEK